MLILAVSTSSKVCSVALLEDTNVLKELNIDNQKTHSENLLPLIDELFKTTGKLVSDVNLIACDNGPGSFTGIRIGVATCKAIAEINKIPAISCSSLEVLSYNINTTTSILCSLIDARNNQVYCGIFDKNHQLLENYIADDINVIVDALKKYSDISFVGDGSILHKDLLTGIFTNDNTIHASNVGICAYEKFNKNHMESADTIVPMYLRKSQAERMRDLK